MQKTGHFSVSGFSFVPGNRPVNRTVSKTCLPVKFCVGNPPLNRHFPNAFPIKCPCPARRPVPFFTGEHGSERRLLLFPGGFRLFLSVAGAPAFFPAPQIDEKHNDKEDIRRNPAERTRGKDEKQIL